MAQKGRGGGKSMPEKVSGVGGKEDYYVQGVEEESGCLQEMVKEEWWGGRGSPLGACKGGGAACEGEPALGLQGDACRSGGKPGPVESQRGAGGRAGV